MEKLNENNEILFWKVIHNKYLFNEIFKQLDKQVIEFNNLDNYYSGNRIKFKYLNELKWFTNKREWIILKDKLKQQEKQQIQLDQQQIEIIKIEYTSVVELIKYCNDKELLKLFYQLYIEKLNEMCMNDLTYYAIENENLEALQVFLIDLKLNCGENNLKLAISNHSIKIIPIIISSMHETIQQQHLIPLTLEWAKQNKKNQNILSFLLNNYYLKYYKEFLLLLKQKENVCQKLITIKQLFLIESKELQNYLLDNDFVYEIDLIEYYGSTTGDYNLKELEFYIKIGSKCIKQYKEDQDDDDGFKSDKTKYTFEKLIKNYKLEDSFYLNYLIKYDMVSPSFSNKFPFQILLKYTFNYLSFNVLLSIYQIITKNNLKTDFAIHIPILEFNENYHKNRIISFIDTYFSKDIDHKVFKFKDWSSIFEQIIFKKCCKECDEIQLLDLIFKKHPSPKLLLFEIPNGYNQNINQAFQGYKWYVDKIKLNISTLGFKLYNSIWFPLNNNENIEFLMKNNEFYQLGIQDREICKNSKNEIERSNVQIYNSNLTKKFNTLFNNSILNCDIETIKFINSIGGIKFDTFIQNDINSKCINNKFNSTINQVLKLFKYLNDEISFSNITGNYFKILFQILIDSFESIEIYKLFKFINFKLFPIEIMNSLLLKFILESNLQIVQLILENNEFNLNQFNSNLINDQQVHSLYNSINDKSLKIESEIKPFQIIELIKLLISTITSSNNNNTQLALPIHIIKLLNLLYNRMLVIKGITIENVNEINQLFELNSIPINIKLFQIFYWLLIKSNRLIKFIYSKSLIEKTFQFKNLIRNLIKENINWNYSSSTTTNTTTTTTTLLDNYINDKIFSFNLIFNSNFNQLFKLLQFQLSDKLNQDYNVKKNGLLKSFEDDVLFLLIIKEMELLFEFIDNNKSYYLGSKKVKEKLYQSFRIESIEDLKKMYYFLN